MWNGGASSTSASVWFPPRQRFKWEPEDPASTGINISSRPMWTKARGDLAMRDAVSPGLWAAAIQKMSPQIFADEDKISVNR
jgi:hypothetical protein